MSPDKVTKFGPGQEFRLDKRVIFVEYESMTGELVKCRFDLSQKTEMIYNDHRILSFDDLTYLYSTDEELFIKKVLYYEQECHMVIGDKLLIPTKVYFENAGYQQAYETNNKLLRNVANSAYGIALRDWADVLADSARYIHMQQSRCNGKTLWLSSATSFADKQPFWNLVNNRDICEQWLKEPPTPKLFKEEQIMRFETCKPTIKNVIFNDPATIVMWSDGTKTVVKCGENDTFDPEKGVAMCCMKKLLGTNKTGSNYLDKVQEYFDSYIEEAVNNVFIGEILGSIFGSKKKPSNSKDIPPEVTVEKEFEAVTSSDWTVVPADENVNAEENGE